MNTRLLFAFLLMIPATSGCQNDSLAANPAPRLTAEAGLKDGGAFDARSDALSDAHEDAPVHVKRTIIERDPFGNYDVTDNLLLDGDFEWSGPGTLQYPWFRVPMLGGGPQDTRPELAFGASCHSGTRCALLKPGQGMVAVAMRPKDNVASLSFWIHPKAPDGIASVHASLTGCFGSGDAISEIDLQVAKKQPDGWLQVTSKISFVTTDEFCLFITTSPKTFQAIPIDQFALTDHDGATTKMAHVRPATAQHLKLVEAWQKQAPKLLGPHVPRPVTPPPGLTNKVR